MLYSFLNVCRFNCVILIPVESHGVNIKKLFCSKISDYCNKLEHSSLASFSCLVWCESPFGCFSQVGSSYSLKHCIRLERVARDKLSNLLRKFIYYGQKSYITLVPEYIFVIWTDRWTNIPMGRHTDEQTWQTDEQIFMMYGKADGLMITWYKNSLLAKHI